MNPVAARRDRWNWVKEPEYVVEQNHAVAPEEYSRENHYACLDFPLEVLIICKIKPHEVVAPKAVQVLFLFAERGK